MGVVKSGWMDMVFLEGRSVNLTFLFKEWLSLKRKLFHNMFFLLFFVQTPIRGQNDGNKCVVMFEEDTLLITIVLGFPHLQVKMKCSYKEQKTKHNKFMLVLHFG